MNGPSPETMVAAAQCRTLTDEYASANPIVAALAILEHTEATPPNLMAAADLVREEIADHLAICGRIEPPLNALLFGILEQLLTMGWAFEHRAWHYYSPRETPLPSTRAALQQEVAR